MIKRIKDKLQDERGVTILMALFALLVAAMVSLVILNAATTAVHQAKNDQEFEQSSLSLLSAAQMVAGELYNEDETKSLAISYKVTTTTGPGGSTSTTDPAVSNGGFVLEDELCASVKSIIPNTSTDALSGTYTISASASNATDGVDYHQDVDVSYVLRHGNYTGDNSTLSHQLIFTFTANAGSANEQSLYLKMQGRDTASTSTNGNTTVVTHTFSWKEPRYYTTAEGANN